MTVEAWSRHRMRMGLLKEGMSRRVARKMTLKGFILLKVTLALIWIKDGSAILGLIGQCAGGTVQGFRI